MSDPSKEQERLSTPVGLPGSGAMRYGAAMYFYARGNMPAEMLEIYRLCCKFDHEDPIAIARFEGIPVPPIAAGAT